ncbi:MAG: hypothetical protein GOVbin631_38 [Prokaryotic dsDNA virus sp.]|nr:MAG: hypothetical protein GOVbin631_38 [Prokaryotic dsDNA virus sp.]|tara:strand:+ start:15302 stop:15940 length:639 start_codon:yes stop_codon:yes gene_type:complete
MSIKDGDKVKIIKQGVHNRNLSTGCVGWVVRVCNAIVLVESEDKNQLVWFNVENVSLEKDVKKTLFEAACEAEDGTEWKMSNGHVYQKMIGNIYHKDSGSIASYKDLIKTDFEQLTSGPKKRDVQHEGRVHYVPSDMVPEIDSAFSLIKRLAIWEGAQIGKPGYAMEMVMFNGQSSKFEPFMRKNPAPITVTFKTKEQCEAAWKAECPEMFE